MSLKVFVLMQVVQMDGTEVASVSRLDTAINANPADPTLEGVLASQMVGIQSGEVLGEIQERLGEYNQALARLLQS